MYINLPSIKDIRKFDAGFVWPVSEDEKEAIFKSIINACSHLFVSEKNYFREQLLRAFLPIFAGTAFTVCYASYLVKSLKKKRIPITDYEPSPLDYFSWLLDGRALDNRIVRLHFPIYTDIKNWARFCARKLNRPDFNSMMLSTNPTAEHFLEMNGIKVYRSAVNEWFGPLSSSSTPLKDCNGLSSDIFEAFHANITVAEKRDLPIKWISDFIAFSINFIGRKLLASYKSRFAKRTRRLFTATQGKLAMRLASLAVMENGGEVISFPHGGGLLCDGGNLWMIEPLTVNKFYCYTKDELSLRGTQMRLLGSRKHASLDLLPQGKVLNKTIERQGPMTNVLFLSGSYVGDRVFVDVLPEILRFDLELKIIDALLENKLKITVKLHRKTRHIDQQVSLYKQKFGTGITFDDTPLTEVIKKDNGFDAFVSENISGGSLTEVIKTEKPVVLFSPLMHRLVDGAKDAFHRRVKVIPCWFNADNRVDFDKDEVRKFFQSTRQAIDFEVVDRFTNHLFEY